MKLSPDLRRELNSFGKEKETHPKTKSRKRGRMEHLDTMEGRKCSKRPRWMRSRLIRLQFKRTEDTASEV